MNEYYLSDQAYNARLDRETMRDAQLEDYQDFLMLSKWTDKQGAADAVCDDELLSELLPGLVHFAATHQKDPMRVGSFVIGLLEAEAYRIALYSVKDR